MDTEVALEGLFFPEAENGPRDGWKVHKVTALGEELCPRLLTKEESVSPRLQGQALPHCLLMPQGPALLPCAQGTVTGSIRRSTHIHMLGKGLDLRRGWEATGGVVGAERSGYNQDAVYHV